MATRAGRKYRCHCAAHTPGDRTQGSETLREREVLTTFHVSPQITQLQVKMGAPEWALQPELARQEYSDVGPCLFRLTSLTQSGLFQIIHFPFPCPGAGWVLPIEKQELFRL